MADAHIVLAYSRDAGIVAIAGGEQYPWAHTALEESGFRRGEAGVYRLPADDADASRATVAGLIICAERHRTSVSTSSRRFIGDAARDIARLLPGQWSAAVEIYSQPRLAGGPRALDMGQRRTRPRPPDRADPLRRHAHRHGARHHPVAHRAPRTPTRLPRRRLRTEGAGGGLRRSARPAQHRPAAISRTRGPRRRRPVPPFL